MKRKTSPRTPHHPPQRVTGYCVRDCRHCSAKMIHAVTFCGTHNVCAVCARCHQHKRIGTRVRTPLEYAQLMKAAGGAWKRRQT